MKNIKYLFIALFALGCIGQLNSCSEKEILPVDVLLNPGELNFKFNDLDAKTFSIEKLYTSEPVTITPSDNWIYATAINDDTVSVIVDINTSEEVRTGYITVTTTVGDYKVKINQDGEIIETFDMPLVAEAAYGDKGEFVLTLESMMLPKELHIWGTSKAPTGTDFILEPGVYNVIYNVDEEPIEFTIDLGYIDVYNLGYGTTEVEYTDSGILNSTFTVSFGTMEVSLSGSIYTIIATFTGEYNYRYHAAEYRYISKTTTLTRKYTFQGSIEFE